MLPLQVDKMPPYLQSWLTSDMALVILFCIFVLEGAMLMYLMPSEAIVPGALVLLGQDISTATVVILVAVAGATVGQFALFTLAKRGGRERLLDHSWVRIDEAKLARFDGWFERWGPLVIPVSNSLLFTRGMLTIPAGFAEMKDGRFIVLSAIGTLVFECALALLTLGILGLL